MHMPFLRLKETAFVGMPAFAQDPAPTPRPPEPPAHQDAPAPEPHPDLKPQVEAIQKRLAEQKYAEALSQSDTLLQQATEKGDKIGQAYAYRFRAWALQGQNRLEEALPAWEQAERLWREVRDGAFLVEALLGRAFCLWRRDEAQAKLLVQESLRLAHSETHRRFGIAAILQDYGVDWLEIFELETAKQILLVAFYHLEEIAPNSLVMGSALSNLGSVSYRQGELSSARKFYTRALEIAQTHNPKSLLVAGLLANLGSVAQEEGEIDSAVDYYKQSLSLLKAIDPRSVRVAMLMVNLGALERIRGDLDKAQQYYEQALEIYEQVNAPPQRIAVLKNNLGVLYFQIGELEKASECLLQSLDIWRNFPESQGLAYALHNLGIIVHALGDFDTAEIYYKDALRVYNKVSGQSKDYASVLGSLGILAFERDDLAVAEQYYQESLKIFQATVPRSLDVARTLNNLGNIAAKREEWGKAQSYYEQSLTIYQELKQVNPLFLMSPTSGLGHVAWARGELDTAREYYEKALELAERFAPKSLEVIGCLNNLANLYLNQKRFQQAIGLLQRSMELVESQRQAIIDAETRVSFGERYFETYSLLASAYLQHNRPAQAAETLERSRARSLAETLQQRQLPRKNLPPALRQLLTEQDRLNAQRLRLSQQLRQLEASDDDQCQQFLRQQLTLNQQQRDLDNRLRKEFPNFARQYLLTPLTLQQIQQSLDAGTVLLYHALAEDHLLIVAVSRTEVKGVARKVHGKQLQKQVVEFRAIVGKPPWERYAPEREQLRSLAQGLYKQLVAPVQGLLQTAKRVLLCPDGVLNQLPWAALIVKTENGKPVYWMERVALHLTPSVGVYRQARAVQPARQGALIAYVSSGVNYPPNLPSSQQVAVAPSDRETRGVTLLLGRSASGRSLPPLKYASSEAQQLQQALRSPLKTVQVVKEAQATPQRARQAAQNARVVHFICHGQADNTDPLGSALLLAPVGKDVGTLTAGEVLMSWKLRADLVMLSACETGLGVTRRYEGVYSLGRAFLVAGSRSVGVSLWKVADASTAALMEAFYKRYAKGVPKDTALREAQWELQRNPRYADPYFWAGFVLIGDYR